ncbi:MAG: beta-ketoacyl-ACP synthase II [Clostridiales bacterium]|nr:beta-ketoacyl-ACP synthase II [Clostridiales bacterium]
MPEGGAPPRGPLLGLGGFFVREREPVVVTGLGVVSPLGTGVDRLWENLLAGRSGVGPITRFDTRDFEVRIGAEVKDFNPQDWMDRKEVRRRDRFTQFFTAATQMALQDAGLESKELDPARVGLAVGTGIGGMETLYEQILVLLEKGPQRVSPFLVPMMIANMAAGQVAIDFGFTGPNATYVTACASSAHAVGEGMRMIQLGLADVVIAGGSEAAFVPITIAGFTSMKALSTRNDEPEKASRPFDAQRDGFVLGEGAAVLILERLSFAKARGARIRAELAGYGMTADAYHITQPAPRGAGGAAAMRLAMADAGLGPRDIQYINAHATSTPVGDVAETQAIHDVFGDHARELMVSSTKSMTGHLLGAAGALEAAITVLTLEHQVVPPTINYEVPDPECDLDYVPNRARPAQVEAALTNSFGFGGQNACLVFKRWRG